MDFYLLLFIATFLAKTVFIVKVSTIRAFFQHDLFSAGKQLFCFFHDLHCPLYFQEDEEHKNNCNQSAGGKDADTDVPE